MKRSAIFLVTAVLSGAGLAAHAQQHNHGHGPGMAGNGSPAASSDAFGDGEIRKVDKAAGKVTIKHGPLPSIDMPPMTMVFRARDPAMLDQVKVGDAIRFKAEKVDGVYTVTEYQPRK